MLCHMLRMLLMSCAVACLPVVSSESAEVKCGYGDTACVVKNLANTIETLKSENAKLARDNTECTKKLEVLTSFKKEQSTRNSNAVHKGLLKESTEVTAKYTLQEAVPNAKDHQVKCSYGDTACVVKNQANTIETLKSEIAKLARDNTECTKKLEVLTSFKKGSLRKSNTVHKGLLKESTEVTASLLGSRRRRVTLQEAVANARDHPVPFTNATHDGTLKCKNHPRCNPAKCRGDTQNNDVLYGGLDCASNPRGDSNEERSKNIGSECLDNLSNGQFYLGTIASRGLCKDLDSTHGFSRQTSRGNVSRVRGVLFGVTTKLFTSHPHMAAFNTGSIGGKRMVCDEDTCDVFKLGLCIKCPADIFASTWERDATVSELSEFVSCCVMGKSTYDNGTLACSTVFAGGAFTATNQANAVLKEAYQCDTADQAKANFLIQAI